MSWYGYPEAVWAPYTPKKKKPWNPSAWKPQAKQNEGAYVAQGYDGKRITLASAGPSGSQDPQQDGTAAEEVQKLKAMMQKLVNGGSLTEDQIKALGPSPMEVMKQEQKVLNSKRKRLTKIRNLEKRLQESTSKFESWLATQKLLVRQEKERYEEQQKQMQKDLEQLQREDEEVEMEEPDTDDFDLEMDKPIIKEKHLENRLAEAENRAFEAQHAMLATQTQLQQIWAYSMQAQQMAGPPMEAAVGPGVGPGVAPPIPANNDTKHLNHLGSPQLPKSVRKEAIKSSQPKPPRTKAKDAKEETVILDDEDGDADRSEL